MDVHTFAVGALIVLAGFVGAVFGGILGHEFAKRCNEQRSVEEAADTTPPQQKWQTQTCKMCGAVWSILPSDPSEKIPLTIEWCLKDGAYCEEGWEIIRERYKNGLSEDLDRRWINHWLKCKGCRCAAFTPEEWHGLLDKLKQVRIREAAEAAGGGGDE